MLRFASRLILAVPFAACATPRAPAASQAPSPAQKTSATDEAPARPETPATPASSGAPAIPDTPAGRTLRAWLVAFNSGDRAQLDAYVTRYKSQMPAGAMAGFRERTGGFDLLGIDESTPLHIEFRVKEKASPTEAVGTLAVKDTDPPQIADFDLQALPPGTTAADMRVKVDAATRARVIDGIAKNLTEFYVDPKVAHEMVAVLRENQKKGAYGAVTDGRAFAALLTEHLRAVSHDRHLRVDCSPMALPERNPARDPALQARRKAQLERDNCGFQKVEVLPGNVGYLKVNAFDDPDICAATAAAAMGFVAHADALIFDLRDNGGGHPEMVARIASYLFKTRTHLNDLYDRKHDKTTQFWTRRVPGKRLPDVPVFVLTSRGTFSGAEEFTYDLQQLKRATIVGETTGGGAHPVGPHRLTDHFLIGVPFARAINPITKTDWEGTGVVPDVKVAAEEALDVATKMAMDTLQKSRQAGK